MNREALIDKIEEELKVSSELGHDFRHTAMNVVAIVEGERLHLDYDDSKNQYEWEE